MTANAKIAIPLTVLIPVVIALSAWQWGLNQNVTENKVRIQELSEQVKEIKEGFKEIKTTINQNYLMTDRKQDSMYNDIKILKSKVEKKDDEIVEELIHEIRLSKNLNKW